MKETIEKKNAAAQPIKSKPPKLAISIQFDSIEERPSTVTSSVRQSINKASNFKPSTSLTLKPSKDSHATMSEYLGKPSPKN